MKNVINHQVRLRRRLYFEKDIKILLGSFLKKKNNISKLELKIIMQQCFLYGLNLNNNH